jgi:RimJ/RimL family protein N-acetyltransferase
LSERRVYGVAVERRSEILPERIEGNGFLLRRWTPSDAETLGRAIAESALHLRPWMAWIAHEPLTLEQRREWLIDRQREWFEGGDVVHGVFIGDEVAGGCGLHRRRGPRTLEIGYWIHPSFTQRGLATAVAQTLTDAAFGVAGIALVEIHYDKANVASSGIPRRLGFGFVGETPDGAAATAEIGIDCTWRVDRDRWSRDRVDTGRTAL